MENQDMEATAFLEASGSESDAVTDEQIQGIVTHLIQDAVDFIDEEESVVRALAYDYYTGQPFGDEEEGRSQVVDTTVRDTIGLMMPSLMRTFFGSDRPVEFVPRSRDDIELADQITSYMRHLILESDGYNQFQAIFQDALLKRIGICKSYFDERTISEEERFTGLGESEFQALLTDDGVEVVESYSQSDPSYVPPQLPPLMDPQTGLMIPQEPPPAPMIYDVRIRRTKTVGKIRFDAVPPEEFLIDRRASSLDKADILAHRRYLTISELVEMGYDYDEVEPLKGEGDAELTMNAEAFERNPQAYFRGGEHRDESQQPVLYTEAYIRLDLEGDGTGQLYRICCAGSGYKVLMLEPISDHPFTVFCAFPIAHKVIGESIFDLVRDIQRVRSSVMRGILDSLALSIHPRMVVTEGQANIQDALSNEMGSIIRTRNPGAVQQLTLPFVGREALPIIQLMEALAESRTGISKASMGLNPEHLQSTSAIGIAQAATAAQAQLELIGRNLAESMKQVFRKAYRLIVRHQPREEMVRLNGRFVPMDPRYWHSDMDVSVNVALGAGTLVERKQALLGILTKQEEMLQALGMDNPFTTPQQYLATLKQYTELSGFVDASRYYGNENYQPPQPEPPKPTPEELLTQAQREQTMAQIQIEQARLEMDRMKLQMEDDRKRDEMESDLQIKIAELEAKYQTSVDVATLRGMMERERNLYNEQTNLDA
jgi:hypothetical protein